jgi:hypothetical protein
MLTVFSAYDDRARPKGSRDPLGAEATWSFLGRRIVGNLTTVTANLDNFIVALLCCHFANQNLTDAELIQERYLRAEQVAAYLKLAAGAGDRGFLGITRASKNFEGDRIVLGLVAEAQLLASQAGYGLWGLYSSALEGADLISGATRRLTKKGEILVQDIVTEFGIPNWNSFCSIASAAKLNKVATTNLAPMFIAAIESQTLRQTVVEALIATQRDCSLQSELFRLATSYLRNNGEWTISDFCSWILNHAEVTSELKTAMLRISSMDPLLNLADAVMSWLLGKNGEKLDVVAQTLQLHVQKLQFGDDWQKELELPHRAFFREFQAAASLGDASAMIRLLMAQNKTLMNARGGAAWIDLDGRSLAVRVKNDKPQDISKFGTPSTNWRYTYFVGSFLAIAQQGMA